MNLRSLLFESSMPGDEVVVYAGSAEHTRSRLIMDAERIAELARTAGLQARCAVAVMLPNNAALVASLFGVWQAGGVYVPVNPRLTDSEVERILTQIEPALVITTGELRHRAGSRPVLVIGENGPVGFPGRGGSRTFDAEVALVQFTSGTTGVPKAVLLAHSGIINLIDGVLSSLRASTTQVTAKESSRRPSPNIVPMSLSLWAGIYNVLFAFRIGSPVVIMDRFDPVDFSNLVSRFGIRSSVLPPAAIAMLASDERVTSLTPLRFVRSVTAPLSPLHARRFKHRFGIAVLNGYGQTEIGGEIVGWTAADSRQYGDSKLGSVGRPHPGVEIRSAHPSGELRVRTPALSAGYLDGSDLSDRIDQDGWFQTGDIGRVDADGFVWIEGRVSDMINRGGMKVHPDEVEEVLRLSPLVADVAVVGVAHDRLGEVPVAFLMPTDGNVVPADLEALCRAHLAPYKVPVRFETVEELPRNEIGKILRAQLSVNLLGPQE